MDPVMSSMFIRKESGISTIIKLISADWVPHFLVFVLSCLSPAPWVGSSSSCRMTIDEDSPIEGSPLDTSLKRSLYAEALLS